MWFQYLLNLHLLSFPEACPGFSSSGANLFLQGNKGGMGGGSKTEIFSTNLFLRLPPMPPMRSFLLWVDLEADDP